jgi:hypothetical protein
VQPDSIFTSSVGRLAWFFTGFSKSEFNSIETSSKEIGVGGKYETALTSGENGSSETTREFGAAETAEETCELELTSCENEKSETALACEFENSETALSPCGVGSALLPFLTPLDCASVEFDPLGAEDELAQVLAIARAISKHRAPG